MVFPPLHSCDDCEGGGKREEAQGEECEAKTMLSFTEAALLTELLKTILLHTTLASMTNRTFLTYGSN
jgi:hypothetical protein